MLANNETGVIQPVREWRTWPAAGALFHTDAVQAAGKLALDVKALGCDLLSISGHKMYAPQGMGALFVRRNVRLRSMFFGGLHERGRAPARRTSPASSGWARPRNWRGSGWPTASSNRLRHCATIWSRGSCAGGRGGHQRRGAKRVANTSNLFFDHVEAEALVIALDLKGLASRAGRRASRARPSRRMC